MKLKKSLLAVPAALALALSACSGSGSSNASKSEDVKGDPAAIITTNGNEPQNPLIPANTNETGGGRILNLIFAGLKYYDADGNAKDEMAESIETADSQKFTVKIKKGWKFSDGTEVKAQNYVGAWKQAVANGYLNASWFEPIVGYSDEAGTDLTGVKVVDDYTFTIELKQPEADFPTRLGYSAYYPLPDSTLADPEKGGEHPVGNGPYKLKGDSAWQHNVKIDLVKSDTYNGPRAPKNGGVTFTFYDKQDAAYADLLAGNVDIINAVPSASLPVFQEELGDRAVNQPSAVFQSFTIPARLPHFSGEEGKLRRQALSYAIDRNTITDKVFSRTRTPAKDFTSPVIGGWSDKLKGSDVLSYDPKKAKELWAKADEISKWDGKFEIAYNSDGGHQEWVDAVCNGLTNTLGIEAVGHPYPSFKELRSEVTNRTIQTAFRSGWQADYPGLYNFLYPLYGTGASSNDGDYSNPEFDALLLKAAAASTPEKANEILNDSQTLLFNDLPAIPLWYSNVSGGFGEGLSGVKFGWDSVPLYYEITKAAK